MAQTGQDNGNIFGGLTQMVVPSAAPVTTPPPSPSFDHLGAIQVAPPAGASKIPASKSIGQKVQDIAEDIIPLAHDAKNIQENIVNPSAAGQQANQIVHENLNEHPERLAMGGEFGEGAMNAAGDVISEIPGAVKEAGGAVVDALAHPTHASAPAEGNPEAGVVRVNPIHSEVRDQLLNRVQQTADAKGTVQRADRAAAEELANKKPYVSPMREPNYVYRSRDIGEQGVPANEDSHAQLTSSKEQAQLYSQPGQRDTVTGKPQEVVRVDLNKLRPSDYATKKQDGDINWHKLKRDIPEELVEKLPVDYHGAAKQAGVQFRGVQKGVDTHPGLAIFQDPESGTSVAVRLDEWSPAKLQQHVAEARARMAAGKK